MGDEATAGTRVLISADGTVEAVDRGHVEALLTEGRFFWLDVHRPGADDLALLRDVFRLHPLALEDVAHFNQRPKIDEYGEQALVVLYGANEDEDRLVEVHAVLSGRYLVTLHRDDCPAFADLRRRAAGQRLAADEAAALLYVVADALVDSFFPPLAAVDDRVDSLQDEILARPDDAQLAEVFRLKHQLVTWRKVVTPQRDLFARLAGGTVAVPGMSEEARRYYRDVYDHLIRIAELLEGSRDLLSGTMDVYLSTVSNRLNEVMRQLTVVATLFMPLSWVVGFFGMNFGAMVRGVDGWLAFAGLGLGSQAAAVAVMLYLFRRRGWM